MVIKSTVRGPCMANVVWEEQANGPEGAYCRVNNKHDFGNGRGVMAASAAQFIDSRTWVLSAKPWGGSCFCS